MSNSTLLSRAAIERVKAYCAAKNWTRSRLAKEAGIGDTTLRNFERDDWNPTVETLAKLERIVPADFMAAAE